MKPLEFAGELTQAEFDTFQDFFYRSTGMRFESSKRYYVDKRILGRITETGAGNFHDYMVLLRRKDNKAELQHLVNVMTINETYFFRDESQFECLVRSILPEVVAKLPKGRTIKIWSSPCSSGEEPYSLALYLLEYWSKVDMYDIEIVGSDIDTHILELAAKGVYSWRSVQHLPKSILAKYFQETAGGDFKFSDDIKSVVQFKRVNIMDPVQTKQFREFDVIFSRNMLIYFDDISRRVAADVFYDSLRPGGFLCVAPTESLSHTSALFKLRRFPESHIYQRPL